MQAAGPSLCSGTEPCLLVRLTLLLMRKRGKRTGRKGKLSPLSGAPQARTRQCMLRLELRRRVRVLWSLDCITATGTSCHIHLPGTVQADVDGATAAEGIHQNSTALLAV